MNLRVHATVLRTLRLVLCSALLCTGFAATVAFSTAAHRTEPQRVTRPGDVAQEPPPGGNTVYLPHVSTVSPAQSTIEGPEDEPANDHLPDIPFPVPTSQTVVDIDGIPLSPQHLLVVFSDAATVADANSLLADAEATVAGSLPEAEVLLVEVPMGEMVMGETVEPDDLAPLGQAHSLLSESEHVAAVALNFASSPANTPNPSANLSDWTWEKQAEGGNWGLEAARIPQMWNLLDHARRQARKTQRVANLAVLDGDFSAQHGDAPPGFVLDPQSTEIMITTTHGTAVVGVAAAHWSNGTGLDGVNPLLSEPSHEVRGLSSIFAWNKSDSSSVATQSGQKLEAIFHLLKVTPDVSAVNVSLAMNWKRAGIDPRSETTGIPLISGTWAELVDEQGDVWAEALKKYTDVLIVAGAGNDADEISDLDSRYASGLCNAASRYPVDVPNVICVEAVRLDGSGEVAHTDFSNHATMTGAAAVSAPGEGIAVLGNPAQEPYPTWRGTSLAAPFVSGLATFLHALDRDLPARAIRQILMSPVASHDVDDAARMVDGFAAAMYIDLYNGDHTLQRALVDVDDGTLDGNLRQKALSSEQSPDTIHTGDKRRGDGQIDMRDFRAFRDAFLIVTKNSTHLDGSILHFKHDLNFDGCTDKQPANPDHPVDVPAGTNCSSAPEENVYPRYDFNGNGQLDPATDDRIDPPSSALAPFKGADADAECEDLGPTCLRDFDVLADEDFWTPGDENVTVGEPPGDPTPQCPDGWLPTRLEADNNQDGKIDYLRSADLHLAVEDIKASLVITTFPPEYYSLSRVGLRIFDHGTFNKCRLTDWSGVVTMPVVDLSGQVSVPRFYYVGEQGDEARQMMFLFDPEPGEDISVELDFNTLNAASTTRGTTRDVFPLVNDAYQPYETLSKKTDSGPFATIVNPADPEDEMMALAGQILLPRSLLSSGLGMNMAVDSVYYDSVCGETDCEYRLWNATLVPAGSR